MSTSEEAGNSGDFKKISFHNNSIVLPGRILQISNISRISSHEIKVNSYVLAAIYLILAVVIASTAIIYERWMGIVPTLGLLGAFFEELSKKKYGIHIQTNGNTSDFLFTKDKLFAEKLYSLIAYYINYRKKDETISIDNSLNVTYGDNILGDKFSDIANSHITNRSTTE